MVYFFANFDRQLLNELMLDPMPYCHEEQDGYLVETSDLESVLELLGLKGAEVTAAGTIWVVHWDKAAKQMLSTPNPRVMVDAPRLQVFLPELEAHLLPIISEVVEIHSASSSAIAPKNDGRFHIYVGAAPAATRSMSVDAIPGKILGQFFVSSHNMLFSTDTGIQIGDEVATVAEFVDNNLYILVTYCKLDLFAGILQKAAEVLLMTADERALLLKTQQENRRKRAFSRYLEFCSKRVDTAKKQARDKIRTAKFDVASFASELAAAKLNLRTAREQVELNEPRLARDRERIRREFDQLVANPYLRSAKFGVDNGSYIETRTTVLTFEDHCGVVRELGEFEIRIPLPGFVSRIQWRNKTRVVNSKHAPCIDRHCEPIELTDFDFLTCQMAANMQFAAMFDLAVQLVTEPTEAEYWAQEHLEAWPVHKPAERIGKASPVITCYGSISRR